MGKTELMNEWRERIEDYRSSGLTASQWCEKTGYSIGRLKYWIGRMNKLARGSGSGGWASVEVVDSGSGSKARIMVRVGVAQIEVERGFDRALLGDIMRVALVLSRVEGASI